MHGFLNGGPEINEEYLALLEPLTASYWRFGGYSVAQLLDARTEFVLSGFFEGIFGEDNLPVPSDDWSLWEDAVALALEDLRQNGEIYDYFDIWNEPDNYVMDGLWADYTALFEVIRRAHDVVRAIEPDALLVAPSVGMFDTFPWEAYFDYLVEHSLRIDAVAWHEFGQPEEVVDHATLIAAMISARPSLGEVELHVNEFSSGQEYLLPGWRVAWLYYLERAGLDWASAACWAREHDAPGDLTTCDSSLNGLFMEDNRTPTPLYWPHYFYGQMTGRRVGTSSDTDGIVAIASRDDETMLILIGRHSCGANGRWCEQSDRYLDDEGLSDVSLELSVADYPFSGDRAVVELCRIPSDDVRGALVTPECFEPVSLPVEDNTVSVEIGRFRDGEAWVVAVSASPRPMSPENLTAVAASASAIDLGWVDSTDNETHFVLEGKTGTGEFRILTLLPADSTSYRVDDLEERSYHAFRVQSGNLGGTSDYSNEASATTLGIPSACSFSEEELCLANGRMVARVEWRDHDDHRGSGHASQLSEDAGTFWFFDDANLELVVKGLDGTGINGHFWTFFASLTEAEFVLTVMDTETGGTRSYVNPSGVFASVGDTASFPGDSLAGPQALGAKMDPMASCSADSGILCLQDDRFEVSVVWEDFTGSTGAGTATPGTPDTGFFWFFNEENIELAINVLDGRSLNGHFWVFFGALSNVEYTVTVVDTASGDQKVYFNPCLSGCCPNGMPASREPCGMEQLVSFVVAPAGPRYPETVFAEGAVREVQGVAEMPDNAEEMRRSGELGVIRTGMLQPIWNVRQLWRYQRLSRRFRWRDTDRLRR